MLYTATFGIETANILQGGTRHIFYLTQDQIVLALKLTWISQPIGIMASAFGKCAVAFLIRRIVGGQNNWRKWFLYVNVALYLSVSIISSVLGFCQCKPADDIWAQVPGAKCWKPAIDADFDLFQSCKNSALSPLLTPTNPSSCSIWCCFGLLPRTSANHHHLESAAKPGEAYRDLLPARTRCIVSISHLSGTTMSLTTV